MPKWVVTWVTSVIVMAVLAVSCSSATDRDAAGGATDGVTSTAAARSGPSGSTVGQAAPEDQLSDEDWSSPGRDLRGNRAVTDSPINSTTIDGLTEAWRVELPGAGAYGNAASGPVIVGDTVVVQDLTSTVRAIDLRTGAVRWTRPYELFSIGPNGPAVGYGRVYVAKGTKEIAALDLETGAEVWTRNLTTTPTQGIDIQPQVFGGMVYASTVPISLEGQYTGGDRGMLYADAATGDTRWSFDTVKGEDLWGDATVNSGGGAWYTPTVDVDTGTIYWGIANPAPFPGIEGRPNGSSRPGPNLYTDSVVALDAATGALRWYHQAVEHDLFDRDLVHTMLVRVADHDVVIGTGKLGRVLGLDPASGDLLWDTDVGVHHNDELLELTGPTEVLPGTFGGVLTPPAAADGVVYVAVINAPSTLEPDKPSYIGSDLGKRPGNVVAVSASDGAVLWSVDIAGDPLGGTTVLGDLVLTATADGLLIALDRATGRQVWTHQAPGGLNGWPAASGDVLVWPIGLASPAMLVGFKAPGVG